MCAELLATVSCTSGGGGGGGGQTLNRSVAFQAAQPPGICLLQRWLICLC